jgi:hypothetical protein
VIPGLFFFTGEKGLDHFQSLICLNRNTANAHVKNLHIFGVHHLAGNFYKIYLISLMPSLKLHFLMKAFSC